MNTYDRPWATVIADSVSTTGVRLTTMEVTFHRFVLAEFNTHRVFSRNSSSSRAIPAVKTVDRVLDSPAIPLEWPTEKPGMQGGDGLEYVDAAEAEMVWIKARTAAVSYAQRLMDLGVHKSVVNRLLEPFMWHTVVVTATEWDNFFEQRCSPLAQPEIRVAAELMRDAYEKSEPNLAGIGFWHTPYIREDEDLDFETRIKVSVARCARVSYLTHNGVRDIEADIKLYDRLISAQPPHWSPMEHVATPYAGNELDKNFKSNFEGWHQWRHVGWAL